MDKVEKLVESLLDGASDHTWMSHCEMSKLTCREAAAELVRLARLNAELGEALEALDAIGALEDGLLGPHGGIPEAQAKARAALASFKEQPGQ